MDLRKSIHVVSEEIMLRVAGHIHKVTGEKLLCLAGGVALNCVGNARISREILLKISEPSLLPVMRGALFWGTLFTWYQYLEKERVVDWDRDF